MGAWSQEVFFSFFERLSLNSTHKIFKVFLKSLVYYEMLNINFFSMIMIYLDSERKMQLKGAIRKSPTFNLCIKIYY